MWVRFLADHDYRPAGDWRTTIAYKAGMRCSVTRECAEQAGAKARAVRTPTRAAAASLTVDPFWRGD